MGGAISFLGPGLCPPDSLPHLASLLSGPLTSLNLGDVTPKAGLETIRAGRATEITGFILPGFRSENRSPGFQFSSVAQSCPTLCDPMNCRTPGLPVHHQILEFTKLMSIESVTPSNHLILCCPLLLLPSIFPSIRVFSNESVRIRWPKDWNFSFNISPFNEHSRLIFRMDWWDLLAVQGTLKSLLRHHSSKASILRRSAFFTVRLSHPYMTAGETIAQG